MKEAQKKKGKMARQRVETASPNVENYILPPLIPLELQQQLLNVFKDSLADSNLLKNVKGKIQEIKQHLYNRDFVRAFGNEEYLKVYAFRWSASRVLSYLNIFGEVLGPDVEKATRIVCIGGGGGAEIVALAGLARYSNDQRISSLHGHDGQHGADSNAKQMSILALDIADWTEVIDGLTMGICHPPTLSKYASEAARVANTALLQAPAVDITFEKHDVLNSTGDDINTAFQGADLVTIMFTLNELFSASITKTTELLLNLTEVLTTGALLLIIDSPGSYSTISLGGGAELKEKKYPMKWLLNYTLLEMSRGDASGKQKKESKWEKLDENDARWFRLDERLQYPVDLESMRYQFHLFRRLVGST